MKKSDDKNKKKQQQESEKTKGLTKRQKNWIYTGIFLTTVLIFFIVNNSNGESEQGPYPPNYIPENASSQPIAPEFILPTSDGKQLKLSDLRGKIVLLDFWATWRETCKKAIPDLIELKNEYGEKGLEIIGVSVDGITRDGTTVANILPFMKEYGINYPIVLSDMQLVNKYGGIQNIPTSFIISREGKIVKRFNQAETKEVYAEALNKLLAEKQ